MFTLKLYRRNPPLEGAPGEIVTKIIPVHEVTTVQIGKERKALELWAHRDGADRETYYIGEPEPGMDAYEKDGNHLEFGPYSWWGWGLLENWEGNTTQHFRPASYG